MNRTDLITSLTSDLKEIFSPTELDRAAECFLHKKRLTQRYKDRDFLLTFREYVSLMVEANISPLQIGIKKDEYCLGRKNSTTGKCDTGNYEIGNCRFVTCSINHSEANLGLKRSEATIRKLKQSHLGQTRSEETKRKLSKAAKSRTKYPCQYCGLLVTKANLARHEKACKHKPIH